MYDFDQVIDRSGSGCFKYDALKLIYGRDDLLPLWVADMDFAIAPEIQDALHKRLQHPIFGYNLRLSPYYEAIQAWTKVRYNWEIERKWIISTPGVVPALNLAVLTLTAPGDGIIIQPPVYAPFHNAVTDHNRRLLKNPLKLTQGRWEIDFDHFDQLAQDARLFVLCNPHNPVGRVFTEDELLILGEICRRHGVIIFSDEIHADIVYSGYKHIPISSLADFSNFTITSFSPAKSFNLAGLGAAVTIAPQKSIFEAVNSLNNKLHLYMGNSFGITALEAAYRDGAAWLDELLIYLETNRNLIDTFLQERLPHITCSSAEGSYLAWVDFAPLGLSGTPLNNLITDTAHLALDPGSKYGEEYSSFQRINYGCPRSTLQTALERLESAIKSNLYRSL